MNQPAAVSPCTAQCGLVNEICKGCLRTRTELKDWRNKPVDDRMALMQELKGQTSTHACPSCEGPAYCAMEAGKSASTCWCMTVTREIRPETADVGDRCMCRKCLAGIK